MTDCPSLPPLSLSVGAWGVVDGEELSPGALGRQPSVRLAESKEVRSQAVVLKQTVGPLSRTG